MGKHKETPSGDKDGVFSDTSDPDYQKILALCRAGKSHPDRIKRFDMPGFRPTPTYVREMKRFGIIPGDLGADTPIDVYAVEEAYWRSLWWEPGRLSDLGKPGKVSGLQ